MIRSLAMPSSRSGECQYLPALLSEPRSTTAPNDRARKHLFLVPPGCSEPAIAGGLTCTRLTPAFHTASRRVPPCDSRPYTTAPECRRKTCTPCDRLHRPAIVL